ncbi:uncharacterized protein LOC129762421 [Toxorhynchites rutilus septentrionalis]|uniref:uncharacterized protein LOC129762421 n=1 Tax=Toxorhynchites rutilus septentrionalis TaxID=329112 RepID=UPI00247A4CF8|nr:uncharacterized protein LOC129762421 [Toxorhynchites rutilus septentrionalis]
MSRIITQEDGAVGYSSEQDDEDDSERDVIITAEPNEIYVGNTGAVAASKLYTHFRAHGYITDMNIWRTHNHLYHARIVYKGKNGAQKAIESTNGKIYNGKRLRVSLVIERIQLEYPAVIRIDDLCAECSEEDIYEHFESCGAIKFVIKTGCAAYIQFAAVSGAYQALGVEKILMGDPYIISRVGPDDRVDHVQVIENMKDIKYRKPFVMVENYPELDPDTPLKKYKAEFERVGPVRHFKIAPTPNGTVTLALCTERNDDRDLFIDRFDNTMVRGKTLKLYMAPGKARMTIDHAAKYALSKTSIVVSGFPPYYKDYDVCKVFRRCGEINFLERFDEKWMICFESQAAVPLAHYYRFMINRETLVIKKLMPATMPGKTKIKLRDYETHVEPTTRTHFEPAFTTTKTKIISEAEKHIDSLFKKNEAAVNKVISKRVASDEAPKDGTSSSTTKPDGQPSAFIELSDEESETPPASETQPESTHPMKNRGIFIGNLPKCVEEKDIRQLFPGKEIQEIVVHCSRDSYHPTAAAYVAFAHRPDMFEAEKRNHIIFRGKRIMVKGAYSYEFFASGRSLMLKNLDMNTDELVVMKEVQKVMGKGTVEDVHKPAHHYAYVDLKEDVPLNIAVIKLRQAFTRFKIDVYPLQKSIPKRWILPKPRNTKSIEDMRKYAGLKDPSQIKLTDERFGPDKANQLFVGNIPRDSQAEDLIQYFNNYGTVIDYKPIEEKSCYLRKSVFLSFIDAKHAENAYRQLNHYFEGSLLCIHRMDAVPLQFEKDASVLSVKFHSPFLTCDEIYHVLSQNVVVTYGMRFDAYDERANLIVVYQRKGRRDPLESIRNIKFINDEAVLFVGGLDLTHPNPDEAREPRNISNSNFRSQKEKYLSYVIYKENLKDDMDLRTQPNHENDVPFDSFDNYNSVQINNVSPDTTMEEIRDLFWKCGNVVDYRAILLQEGASKICWVKFDVDLAADLACTYNQRMLNGKRILVHLAKECPHVERDRSVMVERLSPHFSTEQIYDELSQIGTVKYVQKQTPNAAVVCFKHKDCLIDALHLTRMSHSSVVVNPCCRGYDARFFNNFTVKEEFISDDLIKSVLKPRILPEFHQSELEVPSFDSLTVDVKAQLIEDVFMTRQNIANFNNMTKIEQITELNKNPDFAGKAHFTRLSTSEQAKLLEITETLEREARNQSKHPPPVKQARLSTEPTASNGNGQSSGSSEYAANSFPSTGGLDCPPDRPPWSRDRPQMFHSMFPEQGPSHRNNMMHPARNNLSGQWEQQMASMSYNNSRRRGHPSNFNRSSYF